MQGIPSFSTNVAISTNYSVKRGSPKFLGCILMPRALPSPLQSYEGTDSWGKANLPTPQIALNPAYEIRSKVCDLTRAARYVMVTNASLTAEKGRSQGTPYKD